MSKKDIWIKIGSIIEYDFGEKLEVVNINFGEEIIFYSNREKDDLERIINFKDYDNIQSMNGVPVSDISRVYIRGYNDIKDTTLSNLCKILKHNNLHYYKIEGYTLFLSWEEDAEYDVRVDTRIDTLYEVIEAYYSIKLKELPETFKEWWECNPTYTKGFVVSEGLDVGYGIYAVENNCVSEDIVFSISKEWSFERQVEVFKTLSKIYGEEG